MMQRRRPTTAASCDCTCPECRATERMARMSVLGTAAFWLLVITALLCFLA